uniref:Uncharacterized protein n=1 Tax=Maylandia zebra TaxID=106582 RepID=A0A3P9BK28_9CICH
MFVCFYRRGPNRSTRRKREDEQKPVPVPEAKASHPKFDLAASNFPPLPGSVVSMQEESVPEMRLSDIVRGLKVTNKVNMLPLLSVGKDVPTNIAEGPVNKPDPVIPPKPAVVSTQTTTPPSSTIHLSLTFFFLSYAEVCQKLAKEPLPAQFQPLQELKVNRVEEPRPNGRQTAEKRGDKRPPRQPLRSFRGGSGQARVREPGQKIREHQKGLNTGKRFSPQRAARRSGKEQNIPPSSPK